MDRRRAVMLERAVLGAARSASFGCVTRARSRARPGRPVSLRRRSTRSRRSQPLRSPGKVETMISSTRSSFTTWRGGGVRVGVHDLAVRVDALAAQLGEREAQPAVGVGVLFVVALRRDDQEARRPLRGALADAVEQLVRDDGLVRDHEHVRLALSRAPTTTCFDRDTAGDRSMSRRRRGASSPSAPRRASRRRSRRPSARAARARPSPPAPGRSRRRSPGP